MSIKKSLYYIEWYDAVSSDEWRDKSKLLAERCTKVCEVGWIIDDNKKEITIVSQYNDLNDYGNSTVIRKNWITKKKRLKI